MKKCRILVVLCAVLVTGSMPALAGEVELAKSPARFAEFGINPNQVEPWEDGRRVGLVPESSEWWYNDGQSADGLDNYVVGYYTNAQVDPDSWWELLGMPPVVPYYSIQVNLRDGRSFSSWVICDLTDAGTAFAETGCDVSMVPGSVFAGLPTATFKDVNGDMSVYQGFAVGVDKTTGAPIAIQFTLNRETQSYRPGTGIWLAKDAGIEKPFGWVAAVPKGSVDVTFIINFGMENQEVIQFSGHGYHDHNWMLLHPEILWDTWDWARSDSGDYSHIIFNMKSSPLFTPVGQSNAMPNMVVFDGDGNIVVDSAAGGTTTDARTTYYHDGIGKQTPDMIALTYANGDDTCTITYNQLPEEAVPAPFTDPVIFIADIFQGMWPRTENQRLMKETWGIKPYYSRVLATVDLDIAVGNNVASIHDVPTKYEVMDFWGKFPRDYNPTLKQFELLGDWDLEIDGLFAFTPYEHYRYWGIVQSKMEVMAYLQNLTANLSEIEVYCPLLDSTLVGVLGE